MEKIGICNNNPLTEVVGCLTVGEDWGLINNQQLGKS